MEIDRDVVFAVLMIAICLIGGGINFFATESALRTSKKFIGPLSNAAPEIVWNPRFVKFVGLLAMAIGLVIAAWMLVDAMA